jgi:hypothetical protein
MVIDQPSRSAFVRRVSTLLKPEGADAENEGTVRDGVPADDPDAASPHDPLLND